MSFEKKKLLWITEQMNQTSIIISVIAIILAMILSYLLARSITTPIKRLIEHVRKVSEGDLTSSLESKSQDEIGFLTKSFNQMTEGIRDLIEKVKESSDQVVKSTDEVTQISNETLLSSEQIATAIQEVAVGATKQASEAETINEKSEHLYEKFVIWVSLPRKCKPTQNHRKMQAIEDLMLLVCSSKNQHKRMKNRRR